MAQNEGDYVIEGKQNREAFEQLCCGRIGRFVPGLFEKDKKNWLSRLQQLEFQVGRKIKNMLSLQIIQVAIEV